MLTPSEEATLRDELTVVLLEATSHPDALARSRHEAAVGLAAYDQVPTLYSVGCSPPANRVVPRDVVADCALCGRAFVVGARQTRFCSSACEKVVRRVRYRRGLVA